MANNSNLVTVDNLSHFWESAKSYIDSNAGGGSGGGDINLGNVKLSEALGENPSSLYADLCTRIAAGDIPSSILALGEKDNGTQNPYPTFAKYLVVGYGKSPLTLESDSSIMAYTITLIACNNVEGADSANLYMGSRTVVIQPKYGSTGAVGATLSQSFGPSIINLVYGATPGCQWAGIETALADLWKVPQVGFTDASRGGAAAFLSINPEDVSRLSGYDASKFSWITDAQVVLPLQEVVWADRSTFKIASATFQLVMVDPSLANDPAVISCIISESSSVAGTIAYNASISSLSLGGSDSGGSLPSYESDVLSLDTSAGSKLDLVLPPASATADSYTQHAIDSNSRASTYFNWTPEAEPVSGVYRLSTSYNWGYQQASQVKLTGGPSTPVSLYWMMWQGDNPTAPTWKMVSTAPVVESVNPSSGSFLIPSAQELSSSIWNLGDVVQFGPASGTFSPGIVHVGLVFDYSGTDYLATIDTSGNTCKLWNQDSWVDVYWNLMDTFQVNLGFEFPSSTSTAPWVYIPNAKTFRQLYAGSGISIQGNTIINAAVGGQKKINNQPGPIVNVSDYSGAAYINTSPAEINISCGTNYAPDWDFVWTASSSTLPTVTLNGSPGMAAASNPSTLTEGKMYFMNVRYGGFYTVSEIAS